MTTNRKSIEEELVQRHDHWLFTPATYSQLKCTLPLIQEYVRGDLLLDVGCGYMAIRREIEALGMEYHGLDIRPIEGVQYVMDAQEMKGVPSDTFDAVLCLEVLEHVEFPQKVMREIHRVLRPGGALVLSVPHLSRIHDAPSDYLRFTSFGIAKLSAETGFTVILSHARAGLFSFLGHQVSTLLITSSWRIPVLKTIIWYINAWLITRLSFAIDRWFPYSRELFPLGYSVVAFKPFSSEVE